MSRTNVEGDSEKRRKWGKKEDGLKEKRKQTGNETPNKQANSENEIKRKIPNAGTKTSESKLNPNKIFE